MNRTGDTILAALNTLFPAADVAVERHPSGGAVLGVAIGRRWLEVEVRPDGETGVSFSADPIAFTGSDYVFADEMRAFDFIRGQVARGRSRASDRMVQEELV